MKQQIELKQVQKLSTDLSYKIMQIGEAILEIEEDYLDHFKDEVLKEKIRTASKLLREISAQMEDRHAERMLNWRKRVSRMTQQGFI